jgi:hypothetical protein
LAARVARPDTRHETTNEGVRGLLGTRQPIVLALPAFVPSDPRDVWVHYRTGVGGQLPVSLGSGPTAVRGTLDANATFGWRPLLDGRGQQVRVRTDRTLSISTSLAEDDRLQSIMLLGGQAPIPGIAAVVDIAPVWSGARAGFAAIQHQGKVFVGYYDAERWLSVAEVDLTTLAVRRTRLPSQFAGWDNHNAIEMAFDRRGMLHIAGNMHASPLVYFRAAPPYQAADFIRTPMVGRDETRATYPRFFPTAGGDLVFAYRSGGSGNGAWLLNHWNGAAWKRLLRQPLFGARDARGTVSAYPSEFSQGPDGAWHVSVVWRRTPDAATNFRLTYARSTDLITWTTATGQPVALPLGPDNMDLVADTGVSAGLTNNPQIAVDGESRPVITFTRFANNGSNAVFLARTGIEGNWAIRQVGIGTRREGLSGFGSLPGGVLLTPVKFGASTQPTIEFRLPGSPRVLQRLNFLTLLPEGQPIPVGSQALSNLVDRSSLLVNPVLNIEQVKNSGGSLSSSIGYLLWRTQGLNQDLPRDCDALTPVACQPAPSLLKLILPADMSRLRPRRH